MNRGTHVPNAVVYIDDRRYGSVAGIMANGAEFRKPVGISLHGGV